MPSVNPPVMRRAHQRVLVTRIVDDPLGIESGVEHMPAAAAADEPDVAQVDLPGPPRCCGGAGCRPRGRWRARQDRSDPKNRKRCTSVSRVSGIFPPRELEKVGDLSPPAEWPSKTRPIDTTRSGVLEQVAAQYPINGYWPRHQCFWCICRLDNSIENSGDVHYTSEGRPLVGGAEAHAYRSLLDALFHERVSI